jgi:hypothetical protein
MAKTIPQLTDATTVNAADELIIQQGGITKRATGAELATGINTINNLTNSNGLSLSLLNGVSGNGHRFEIQKHDAPLNYAANTRAAFVCQVKDTQNLGSNELVPAAMFDFTFTGTGNVNAPLYFSDSIWMGLTAVAKKYNNGSGHCFTGIGELHAPNAAGYNELGGIQGTLTNMGSTNGNMSGFEWILKDSPDNGTNSYPTFMKPVISRAAQFNAGSTTRSFFASSEGSQNLANVLSLNPQSTAKWVMGIDFTELANPFSTGVAVALPNNSNISWTQSGGLLVPVLGVGSIDQTYLRCAANNSVIQLQTFAGESGLEVDNNSTDRVFVFVGGSLKRLLVGAADSGGTGFKQLVVAN